MKKKKHRVVGILGAFLGIFIIFIIAVFMGNREGYTKLEGPFYITDNNGVSSKFKYISNYAYRRMKESDWVQVSFKTLGDSDAQKVIMFNNSYCMVEVYQDNELIYKNCDKVEDANYKKGLEIIQISNNKKSDVIVRFSTAHSKSLFKLPIIYTMDSINANEIYLQKNCVLFGGSVVFIIFGVVVILFGALINNDEIQLRKIMLMAVCCIVNSIWFILDSRFGVLFIKDIKVLFILKHISIMVSILVWIGFIMTVNDFKKKTVDFMKKCIVFDLVYIFASLVLQLTNLIHIDVSLIFFIILQVIFGAFLMSLLLQVEHIRIDKMLSLEFIAYLAGIIILLVKMGIFAGQEKNLMSNNPIPYFIMALIIFYLIRIFAGFITRFKVKVQVVFLENLAYVDPLTGLANRNMCEKKFDEIDNISVGQFELIMFDVRGLKYINDNFGHKSGDELIVVFAKALKMVFGEKGSFVGRMGGDEFVVIVEEENIDETFYMMLNLDKYLAHINSQNKYKFNIAYHHGTAICDRTRNHSVWKKYSEADSNMYENDKKKECR